MREANWGGGALRRLAGAPFRHGFAAFALVAVGAEQLQVVGVIRPAARLWQDVIDFHDLEGKMRLVAGAVTFLLAVKRVKSHARDFADLTASLL